MSGIEIHRTIHIEQVDFLQEAAVFDASYAANDRDIMLESLQFGSSREFYFRDRGLPYGGPELTPQAIRRSEDNGRTWRTVETWERFRRLDANWRWQRWVPKFILDPWTGAVLRLYMTGCPGNVGRHETCGVPPHSYRYEIVLPQ